MSGPSVEALSTFGALRPVEALPTRWALRSVEALPSLETSPTFEATGPPACRSRSQAAVVAGLGTTSLSVGDGEGSAFWSFTWPENHDVFHARPLGKGAIGAVKEQGPFLRGHRRDVDPRQSSYLPELLVGTHRASIDHGVGDDQNAASGGGQGPS